MITFAPSGICSQPLLILPAEKRRQAWARLARDLPLDKLDTMIVPARLADLPRLAPEILAGRVRGRVVVAIKV